MTPFSVLAVPINGLPVFNKWRKILLLTRNKQVSFEYWIKFLNEYNTNSTNNNTFHPSLTGSYTRTLHTLFSPAFFQGVESGGSDQLRRTQALTCSCFPGRASVNFLSELWICFSSPPFPSLLWRWTWPRNYTRDSSNTFWKREKWE